ncbi:hypothetical protein PAP_05860 [Palaeococcus pacificus DY20341]|uniref:Fe-S hydro-lyase tartrate dehydratase beta-type catalytic domain-containing protein n=1 Tax=Palaeococcus pacificus DY20341 TaxID=1343739 RepID=A0A075LUB8_9EURY|nr:FumA C-terminus/TtdB family hydratase beta subunit [Palaeococcus pacificus]AIF69572.1 hypothetical protein PAP_05860 [Palaeococcus pacificus DY20341]
MAVRLKTPLREEDVLKLKAGDIVKLSGIIYTARDLAHRKIIELAKREELPFNLKGAVIYHCGPIVRKTLQGYEVVSAGPTTSARMEKYSDDILSLGVKGLIGKGGMGEKTLSTLQKHKAVYFAFTGGAGALAAKSIKRVLDVYWLEELGIPEAVWILEIEDLPLVVAMDAYGNSLYKKSQRLMPEEQRT